MRHGVYPGMNDRHVRRGFTLVELLVALVIAVLVASALVALYRTATRTVADQGARARGPHAASRALDQLAEDLGRAVLNTTVTNESLVLEQGDTQAGPGGNTRLSFSTLDPVAGDEPDWTLARQVSYRVESEGRPSPALVRVHRPLTGPGSLDAPVTNVLVPDVEVFRVALLEGSEWHTNWAGRAGDGRRPQAARVIIGSARWTGDPPVQQADLMIPAGLSVTSRLVRSATTAP